MSFSSLPLKAERTEEFEKQLQWYIDNYKFVSLVDTFFTFESEFQFPEGYERLDKSELSDYSFWISYLPIWHKYKPVGSWDGRIRYEKDSISRVVHIPWIGTAYKEYAFPVRILGEYFVAKEKENDFCFYPPKGEVIDYRKWLTGQPAFTAHLELFIKPDEEREPSIREFYKLVNFCLQYSDYATLKKNCDTISASDLQPGDLLISTTENQIKGKVYLIINMISNKSGDKLYAIATGCEDACDFHIPLVNDNRDYPWLTLDDLQKLGNINPEQNFYRFKVFNK